MSEKFKDPSFKKETNTNEIERTLDRALRIGNLAEIEALFDAGMDIDQADPQGRTALMLLSAAGNINGVEEMLSRGAEVNVVFMFQGRIPMTALDAAMRTNRPEIVELLRSRGAKIGKEVAVESLVE